MISVRITTYQSIGISKPQISYSPKRSTPLTSTSTILTDMQVSSQCSVRTSLAVPINGMVMRLSCTLVLNTQLMERGTISNSRFYILFIRTRKKRVALHQEVVDTEEILQVMRLRQKPGATLQKNCLSEKVATTNQPSQSFSALMSSMKFPKKRVIYSNCSLATLNSAKQIHM